MDENNITQFISFKGVFAKNERGYWLNAIKNPRNRNKRNSQIITIKTYYEKSTIYKCGER